jgi:hypothetical protein
MIFYNYQDIVIDVSQTQKMIDSWKNCVNNSHQISFHICYYDEEIK